MQRSGRLGRQLQPLLAGKGEHSIGRHHLVGEPESQRLLGINRLGQQQQLRRLEVPHQTRQQQAGGKLRHQPQLDEGELQAGVIRQIDHIAVQQNGGANPHCRARNGGDHRFGEVGKGVEELQDGVVGLQRALAHKVGQIIARGKAILLPLQQQDMHLLIGCRLSQRCHQLLIELGIEGVALVGAVEGQGEQAILLLGNENGGHV